MFHPLSFLVSFLAKQSTVTTFVASAQAYGVPRLYKLLLRTTRTQLKDEDAATRALVEQAMKVAIRSPTQGLQLLADTRVAAFAVKYVESIRGSTTLPPFVTSITEMLFKKTPMGRAIDVIRKVAYPNKPAR